MGVFGCCFLVRCLRLGLFFLFLFLSPYFWRRWVEGRLDGLKGNGSGAGNDEGASDQGLFVRYLGCLKGGLPRGYHVCVSVCFSWLFLFLS